MQFTAIAGAIGSSTAAGPVIQIRLVEPQRLFARKVVGCLRDEQHVVVEALSGRTRTHCYRHACCVPSAAPAHPIVQRHLAAKRRCTIRRHPESNAP